MDWKNKHFDREAVFQARRDLVFEAARSFAAESLVGWQITDTAEGFEARGLSASHEATAKFQIEPAPGGTKVAVKLLVERASPLDSCCSMSAAITTVRLVSGWRAFRGVFMRALYPPANSNRWNK